MSKNRKHAARLHMDDWLTVGSRGGKRNNKGKGRANRAGGTPPARARPSTPSTGRPLLPRWNVLDLVPVLSPSVDYRRGITNRANSCYLNSILAALDKTIVGERIRRISPQLQEQEFEDLLPPQEDSEEELKPEELQFLKELAVVFEALGRDGDPIQLGQQGSFWNVFDKCYSSPGDDVLCDGYHQLSAGEMINRLLDTEESLCRAWTQVVRASDQNEEEALNHGTLPKMVERMGCTNLACARKMRRVQQLPDEGGPLVSGMISATSQDVRDVLAAREHEPCTLATCKSCAAGQGTRQKVRTFALAPELLIIGDTGEVSLFEMSPDMVPRRPCEAAVRGWMLLQASDTAAGMQSLSVHKSQGMTVGKGENFEYLVVSLGDGKDASRTPGLFLTALTRVTGPDRLALYSAPEDRMQVFNIGSTDSDGKRREFAKQLSSVAADSCSTAKSWLLEHARRWIPDASIFDSSNLDLGTVEGIFTCLSNDDVLRYNTITRWCTDVGGEEEAENEAMSDAADTESDVDDGRCDEESSACSSMSEGD